MGTAPATGAQAQPADTLDVRLQQTTGIRLRGMEIEGEIVHFLNLN